MTTYSLDPELAAAAALPTGDWSNPKALREARATYEEQINQQFNTEGVDITDHLVAGLPDQPAINLRIYQPKNINRIKPGLLHFHGGGYALGSVDSEHGTSIALARLGVVVVSVDYRLAPEHPYPAALDDCYGALIWLHANAAQWQVDTRRIAVYGHSAGGGLAAAVALRARDENGPALCFQFLGMPEIDDRTQTSSMLRFVDTPVWSTAIARKSWAYYLGEKYTPGAADVPYLAAPARAENLSGLPPAYVTAMEFDPLRDEDIDYGLRLLQAGVAVELHTFPGTYHGSALVVEAAISKRQAKEMFVVLTKALKLE